MSKPTKEQSQVNNQPLAIPARFLERMQTMLGADFPAFSAIYEQLSTRGLRVNTLKLAPEAFLNLSPFSLSPLSWNPSGFLLDETDERPGKHPFHAAGLYYLQDPHAQAVAEVLAPQPGERVLDLAAAPGGKTTHIASLMQNQGLLIANEIKTKRIGHLAANLERWGARNVTVINETPERLADFFGPFFDRVLVDAPCSGEGMFRKDAKARADWSEDMIVGCAARQIAILHYAARLVRPGGKLCYSTCTFAPDENEDVIDNFLQEHPDFEAIHVPSSVMSHASQTTHHGARLWPHISPGEGHFIALLQREGAQEHSRVTEGEFQAAKPPVRAWFDDWCVQNLAKSLSVVPIQVGARLYAVPEGLPNLHGLRVFHPGWWLGNLKKDRFEPAHALAMGMHISDAKRELVLPVDDPSVLNYLRCGTLPSDGERGWVLVGLSAQDGQSFPLGWGKRVQGVLKNHYPRGLAWR